MSKRIILLDATTISNSDCMRKIQLSNRQGLVPKLGSDPLDFGQALHRGVADFRNDLFLRGNQSIDRSVTVASDYYMTRPCPKEKPRTLENLKSVLRGYFEEVIPKDPFTPLILPDKSACALEIPFKIPLYSNERTDVLLSGVVDGVGTYGPSKRRVVFDTKHSATYNIKNHLKEQLERAQFHIYTYAMKWLGYSDNPDKYLPIVIDAIYIDNSLGGRFERSPVTQIPDYMIERTMDNARWLAKQMADLPDDIDWPHNFNACHGKYRLCDFYSICSIPSKSQHVPIQFCFSKRTYDPSTFGE